MLWDFEQCLGFSHPKASEVKGDLLMGQFDQPMPKTLSDNNTIYLLSDFSLYFTIIEMVIVPWW